MSAFIISHQTMNAVITGIKKGSGDIKLLYLMGDGQTLDCQRLFDDLYALNVDAIRARYRNPGCAPNYKFSQECFSKIESFKATQCLLYQCSEGNVPDEKLFKLLEDHSNELAKSIVQSLPEYERSSWG